MSYDKQGGEVFVKKKLMRLGVPFVLMAGIISCLSGKVEFAHMWFVESLLLFCLIYALIRRWTKPIDKDCSSAPTLIGLLMVGAVIGVGSYSIRQVSPQDHWIWPFWIPISMEPAHYLQYVMMFVLGILSYRFQWLQKMSNKVGATALCIGAALAIGIYLRNGGAWDSFVGRWFGIYESLLCVFISFGLIWLFWEAFNRSNAFMKWCAAQAYGAYVFHLLLMIGLQYATDSIWMGAFGKFFFIGTVTTIASFCLTWAVKMIPGVKKVL